MECRDVDKLINPYLDRELSEESARALESHWAHCPACRARHGALASLLTRPAEMDVPAGLRDRILAALPADRPPGEASVQAGAASARRWRPRAWLAPGAVAAAVALFAFGWWSSQLWNHRRGGDVQLAEGGRDTASPTAVVVSPWVLSSYLQAAALRSPAGPTFFLAQAWATETMAASLYNPEPVQRCGPPIDPSVLPGEGIPLPQFPVLWPVRTPLGV